MSTAATQPSGIFSPTFLKVRGLVQQRFDAGYLHRMAMRVTVRELGMNEHKYHIRAEIDMPTIPVSYMPFTEVLTIPNDATDEQIAVLVHGVLTHMAGLIESTMHDLNDRANWLAGKLK